MASRRAKWSETWDSGQYRYYMCNFWNFGQWLSFMPKYGNFENWPVSSKPLPVEQKYAHFRPLGVESVYTSMCNFWSFGQWPSFMPKHGNFENHPVSRKPLPVERKISLISTRWGRKSVYVQLLELYTCSNVATLKISERFRRAKISSISTPWDRKRVDIQLLELLPVAKFHAQILQF